MASLKQSIAAIFYQTLWYFILLVWYTIVDVIISLLRTTRWINDSQLPIRGPPGVEHMPPTLSSATIQLEDIRQIKNNLGGVCDHSHMLAVLIHIVWFTCILTPLLCSTQTVNDVITGVIFYGMQRYLQIRLSAGNNFNNFHIGLFTINLIIYFWNILEYNWSQGSEVNLFYLGFCIIIFKICYKI